MNQIKDLEHMPEAFHIVISSHGNKIAKLPSLPVSLSKGQLRLLLISLFPYALHIIQIVENSSFIKSKFNFDISIYSDSIYDIYSYKNSENVVTKQISSFKDYVGILSINDFYNAKIDSKLPPEGKYDNNFIVDILESTGKSTVLEVNTSNIIVDENNNTIGVAKILRSNGSWFMLTNYNIDINYSNNVIPVITLKSNINFESGDGSIENPYIVK